MHLCAGVNPPPFPFVSEEVAGSATAAYGGGAPAYDGQPAYEQPQAPGPACVSDAILHAPRPSAAQELMHTKLR